MRVGEGGDRGLDFVIVLYSPSWFVSSFLFSLLDSCWSSFFPFCLVRLLPPLPFPPLPLFSPRSPSSPNLPVTDVPSSSECSVRRGRVGRGSGLDKEEEVGQGSLHSLIAVGGGNIREEEVSGGQEVTSKQVQVQCRLADQQ